MGFAERLGISSLDSSPSFMGSAEEGSRGSSDQKTEEERARTDQKSEDSTVSILLISIDPYPTSFAQNHRPPRESRI